MGKYGWSAFAYISWAMVTVWLSFYIGSKLNFGGLFEWWHIPYMTSCVCIIIGGGLAICSIVFDYCEKKGM